eukprot:GHVQ01018536.1.p1 GENE.GHVQ01018536.1~~GHVQ01018536.1.p1  ORF type:complete len:380 (-),score=29.14 GHVQ01018536.1:233-1372(-)
MNEVLERLEEVMDAAIKRGVYFKMSKAQIFPRELALLGHLVSVNGYRADPKRVEGGRKMKKYVWWQSMQRDVHEFVHACLPCMRNRKPVSPTASGVLLRPTAMNLISLDYVGPRTIVDEDWYYLVIIDHCTRFEQTHATKSPTAAFAVSCLHVCWLPVFGAPRAVLAGNQPFREQEFVAYVRDQLMSHLVYSSPWFPQGNALNESCHLVLEHSIRCELQTGCAMSFHGLLSHTTLSYNATYQSALGDAPFAVLFGTPPVLPGFQTMTSAVGEDSRLALLNEATVRRQLSHTLPRLEEAKCLDSDTSSIRVGDFVLFPRSPAEITRDSHIEVCTKYQAKWSLPARVIAVNDKQLDVVEYVTGRSRKAPISQCKKLPTDIA